GGSGQSAEALPVCPRGAPGCAPQPGEVVGAAERLVAEVLRRLREAPPALPGEPFLPLDHDADLHGARPPRYDKGPDSLHRVGVGGRLKGAMASAGSKRLLLLIPTSTYRTEDFMEAARRLAVALVVASEKPNVMAGEFPDHLLTLPFDDPAAAARAVSEYAR